MLNVLKSLLVAAALACAAAVSAIDLEDTHWWTSGGEVAAVCALDATGTTWLDGAIAGSGNVAGPIIISRIFGRQDLQCADQYPLVAVALVVQPSIR